MAQTRVGRYPRKAEPGLQPARQSSQYLLAIGCPPEVAILYIFLPTEALASRVRLPSAIPNYCGNLRGRMSELSAWAKLMPEVHH